MLWFLFVQISRYICWNNQGGQADCSVQVECLAQILCRSQRSLKRFHLEHVTNLLRDTLGKATRLSKDSLADTAATRSHLSLAVSTRDDASHSDCQ